MSPPTLHHSSLCEQHLGSGLEVRCQLRKTILMQFYNQWFSLPVVVWVCSLHLSSSQQDSPQ